MKKFVVLHWRSDNLHFLASISFCPFFCLFFFFFSFLFFFLLLLPFFFFFFFSFSPPPPPPPPLSCRRQDGLGGVIQPEAIEFCARKGMNTVLDLLVALLILFNRFYPVAAVSGDARRALDICRRAAELAQRDKKSVSAVYFFGS